MFSVMEMRCGFPLQFWLWSVITCDCTEPLTERDLPGYFTGVPAKGVWYPATTEGEQWTWCLGSKVGSQRHKRDGELKKVFSGTLLHRTFAIEGTVAPSGETGVRDVPETRAGNITADGRTRTWMLTTSLSAGFSFSDFQHLQCSFIFTELVKCKNLKT